VVLSLVLVVLLSSFPIRKFRIEHKDYDIFFIPEVLLNNFKGLVISDCHLMKSLPISLSLPAFIKDIKHLIDTESPTCMFILGDQIQGGIAESHHFFAQFCTYLDCLGIPVFIIAGNHDRNVIHRYRNSHKSKVQVIKQHVMCIENQNAPDGTPKRLFFAHDFHDHPRLNPSEVVPWIRECKRVFSDIIDPEDFLFTGHTHTSVAVFNERFASVAPFSIDLNQRYYAIITMEPEFRISHKEHPGNFLVAQ